MKRLFLEKFSNSAPSLLLIAITGAAFFPWLGNVHLFDWDEINFAEAAREMIATGNYSHVQINFEPFYEKPPLFFWLQVLSMKLWGVNEFAARFPNALFGSLTILTLYLIGKDYTNTRFGLLWAFMHLSALLPHFYFKTGIIDPVFNYFIFIGVYCLSRLVNNLPTYAIQCALLGGLALGLAILTKGPVGLLLPAFTFIIYWIQGHCKPVIRWPLLSLFTLTSLFIPLLWLSYETYQNGGLFIKAFMRYQLTLFSQPVAGHAQPFYYHFVVVFLGCFPASILALGSFGKPSLTSSCKLFSMMQILFWVVMIIFSLVTTKIVHYTSMAYFPISFLAAHYLHSIDQKLATPSRLMCITLMTVGMLVAILLVALPVLAIYKARFYKLITDEFTLASVALPVPWKLRDCLAGVSYLIGFCVGYYFFRQHAIMGFVRWCSVATTCCLTLGAVLIVPKIEAHTQRSAIEFYKSLVGQSVYVTTVGFKSYAPFFYFQQPKDSSVNHQNLNWLLTGKLDKPAYFVVKISDRTTMMEAYPDINLIKIAGGFAFFRRDRVK